MKTSYRRLLGWLLACQATSVGLLACGGSDQPIVPTPQPDGGIESGGSRHNEAPPPVDATVSTPDARIPNRGSEADGSVDALHPSSDSDARMDAALIGTNTTVETAQAIGPNQTPVPGAIEDPNTLSAWYKFEGKANDALVIFTTETKIPNPDYKAYFDPIVELYDGNGTTRIAAQDNPNPRDGDDPKLYVVLPKDGTYYIRVADCTSVSYKCGSTPGNGRATFKIGITSFDRMASFAIDKEPNDNISQAGTWQYVLFPTNNQWYQPTDILGTFNPAETDVDSYSFTIPPSLFVPDGYSPVATFYIQLPGDQGNGSTTSIGLVTVTDGERTLARFDAKTQSDIGEKPWLVVPVERGKTYYIHVKNGTSRGGFYVFRHGIGGFRPTEKSVDNHSIDKAEVLKLSPAYEASYFLQGALKPGEPDYFSVMVPDGYQHFFSDCGAQILGSGLRGLTLDFLEPDGTPIPWGNRRPETESLAAAVLNIQVPVGITRLVMKVSANAQAADVAGSYYGCRVHFYRTPQ